MTIPCKQANYSDRTTSNYCSLNYSLALSEYHIKFLYMLVLTWEQD